MTADIVERLRAAIRDPECPVQFSPVLMTARAEIEHLRHEIADYQRIVRTAEPGDNRISAAELERIAQADEIERLLGACKNKADLLKDAYAQVERLRAENTSLHDQIKRMWDGDFIEGLKPLPSEELHALIAGKRK